jgi:hypothetical protein
MSTIEKNIASADWASITNEMHEKGFAQINGLVSSQECDELKINYNAANAYRKTVVMERYRFGLGEYRYFTYPLPDAVQTMREKIYPYVAPVANQWMEVLGVNTQFPELTKRCHDHGQHKATPLILRYGKGGHNTLHQDLYGDVYFPMQAVLFLSDPQADYDGGEFVLVQQTPRAQSKAIVLRPGKGDLLIFTTNFRPVKGTRGYYRVNMKHGVSEVHRGERYTLGIIFHDATS